jgi:peptidoglycan/xylan/chitin deacetylase (PgdA/CDA1 family)
MRHGFAAVAAILMACGPGADLSRSRFDAGPQHVLPDTPVSPSHVACSGTLADCDGDPANGCETDLIATATSCGACGHVCTAANGSPVCANGTCGVASCDPGFVLSGGTCAPKVHKTLVQDFTAGTFPLATSASADGAAVSLDPRGATKVTFTSAAMGEFTGLKVIGSWDLSSSDLFALDVGFDATETATRVAIFFCSDTGATFENCASATGLLAWADKTPRVAIPILKTDFSLAGAARWSSVRRIEIRLVAISAPNPASMYLYGLWGDVSARPKVLLSFDDGNATVYTRAFPVMSAAGMAGTLYLNGNRIDTAGGLSLSQVQEMYASGWDVANHTIDHTPLAQMGTIKRSGVVATFTCNNSADEHGLSAGDFVTISGADQPEYNGTQVVTSVPAASSFTFHVSGSPLTAATGWIAFPKASEGTLESVIQRQTDWAMTHGLLRGQEHFAYPQGYFDDRAIAILQRLGFKTARTVNVDPLDYSWPTINGLNDPYHIPAYTLTSASTASGVLALVDNAVARASSIHVYGHILVEEPPEGGLQFSTAQFQALIDGLKERRDQGLLDVVTITGWYDNL